MIVKITLAIRLLEILLRTSYNLSPRGRDTGIPIGQPYSSVFISVPILSLSSALRTFKNSFTGSFPEADL